MSDRLPGRAKRKLRGAKKRARGESTQVPGPTPNPATNLLLADIVMRMGSYVLRHAVERAFLRGRYGKGTAKEIVARRSIPRTLTSIAIAKIGTRSIPGAAVVGTGIVAKTLVDRSKARRAAQAEGDRELLDQAQDD